MAALEPDLEARPGDRHGRGLRREARLGAQVGAAEEHLVPDSPWEWKVIRNYRTYSPTCECLDHGGIECHCWKPKRELKKERKVQKVK